MESSVRPTRPGATVRAVLPSTLAICLARNAEARAPLNALEEELAAPLAVFETPPPRCSGYGALQSISLTTWEAGLAGWTVGRRQVYDPAMFSTPDWQVVGNLPSGRSGNSAFVVNLNTGNGTNDVESGVLMLLSPAIVIPAGTGVLRISFHHWFGTEFRWDGVNLWYSVNGAEPFTLLPASAIEHNSYNATLIYQNDFKDNPLSPPGNQPAYTGPDSQANGVWSEVHISLLRPHYI